MHIFINRLLAFAIEYKSSKNVVFRRVSSKSRVLNMISSTRPSSNYVVPGTSLVKNVHKFTGIPTEF
jgi:hypothetical protein